MQHKFRFHKEPFLLIKKGKKTIESRLFDEKRQKIKDFLESLEIYYSKEKQKDFGVVAFEFLKK